jgi:predicted phage gp36 major capsid-like protein
MSGAERTRKYREKLRHSTRPVTKPRAANTAAVEIAALKRRIAELEQRDRGQVTRAHREERGRPMEFTEVGKLRAEIGRLKSDNFQAQGDAAGEARAMSIKPASKPTGTSNTGKPDSCSPARTTISSSTRCTLRTYLKWGLSIVPWDQWGSDALALLST